MKNMGFIIADVVEKRDRKEKFACHRKENYSAQAKRDFAFYATPNKRRHPSYR